MTHQFVQHTNNLVNRVASNLGNHQFSQLTWIPIWATSVCPIWVFPNPIRSPTIPLQDPFGHPISVLFGHLTNLGYSSNLGKLIWATPTIRDHPIWAMTDTTHLVKSHGIFQFGQYVFSIWAISLVLHSTWNPFSFGQLVAWQPNWGNLFNLFGHFVARLS